MHTKNLTHLQKITVSAVLMALYIVLMYVTQGFAFGAYQIRIATALYALAYLCPFLILPLGFANLLSNTVMGGFGLFDSVGGLLVGALTCTCIWLLRKYNCHKAFIAFPVILIPGLGVATWLSFLLHIPYPAMALSLCIGQIIPGIVGVLLVKLLENKL